MLSQLFHCRQEALSFFFALCHKGGVTCISEVIDISPGSLDSSLCFIQPSIFHDVVCECPGVSSRGMVSFGQLQDLGVLSVAVHACNVLKRSPLSSLLAQMVKLLPTMRETWVQSLGWEDLLEKEMSTHSSILAWKNPWSEEPGRL